MRICSTHLYFGMAVWPSGNGVGSYSTSRSVSTGMGDRSWTNRLGMSLSQTQLRIVNGMGNLDRPRRIIGWDDNRRSGVALAMRDRLYDNLPTG